MTETIWAILGIGPTTDTRIIRSAYAEKCRMYHPEEHPEAFQRLNDAYRIALDSARRVNAAARGRGKEPQEPAVPLYAPEQNNIAKQEAASDGTREPADAVYDFEQLIAEGIKRQHAQRMAQANEMAERIKQLCADAPDREEPWKLLINTPQFSELRQEKAMIDTLAECIRQSNPPLSRAVGKLLYGAMEGARAGDEADSAEAAMLHEQLWLLANSAEQGKKKKENTTHSKMIATGLILFFGSVAALVILVLLS